MGQYHSRNRNYNSNDELINALIKSECIHSNNVEKAFRSVDRGLYYTNDNKLNAYTNVDWKSGDVHLSSPSDYAIALECLDLHKGHKFLNIGSGIGYFSTLAGLLLGINGVNHGIEIHSSLIDMAYQKLEVFKQNSAAIDYFEFCEPVFIKGNACELLSVGYYDRVYCGADVPPAKSSFMKDLIKIGGVLVMPLDGVLVKVTRNDEHSWKTMEVLEVSIPDLVVAKKCRSMNVSKFSVEPLSLRELCRSHIRASIQNCLNESHPGLQMRTKCNPNISFEEKLLKDSLNGDIEVSNYLSEMRECEENASYLVSTPVDEAIEEDNDDDNIGDDVDVVEKETSEQCDNSLIPEKDTKRKVSEAQCSEENKTLPEEQENTKRMRMNTALSSTFENLSNSLPTSSSSGVREIITIDSSESDDEEYTHNGMYNDLVDDSDTDDESAGELIKYRFLSNRKENELSKLLKVKINMLPVPDLLKAFLNYNIDG